MARTWFRLRSVHFFLAPKIRNSARKSVFSYGNLFFCTETRIAQVVTQILRPTDLVYDFSFPSYARFREGTRPMPQKVFPHPTVRAPSASNSPSALSARALRARALRARAGYKLALFNWLFDILWKSPAYSGDSSFCHKHHLCLSSLLGSSSRPVYVRFHPVKRKEWWLYD